ncbi:hypothetical protein [Azospirillum canadense]|uniref:hypothetical protein n=1 Tax=Azospirillum canadense TaxID=403962 RepID=UPI0022275D49|nr:hypothetical protein [Azospirillum canadense]MCW2240587.1 hypothetical protein [Azospirillum canadense]
MMIDDTDRGTLRSAVRLLQFPMFGWDERRGALTTRLEVSVDGLHSQAPAALRAKQLLGLRAPAFRLRQRVS